MRRTVSIDCFPESVARYSREYAIVAIDVIRATTTAITAVAAGRRCHPVSSLEAAFRKAATLEQPILAGELGGDMPDGFDMNNSPAELEARTDRHRPVVMLSSSGTKLITLAAVRGPAFLACFRNYAATARHLASRYSKVAVIGAGSRSEFREEDQMCCAWIAELLIGAGFEPENPSVTRIIERWSGAPPESCLGGRSANYLIRSGQSHDLTFILARVNDLEAVFPVTNDEVQMIPEPRLTERAATVSAQT
ncbi:MAG TPA: 2-phosphosulfolactate phosphatase [Bryobacteraceae bacterium]|nr:2-phosphosulfolactate phosphatase [Bryobacteraceae bacterium]